MARAKVHTEPYGLRAEFGPHRVITMRPGSTVPRSTATGTQTVYVVSGNPVCEFRYPGGKMEQIGMHAEQWAEIGRGVTYSLRTRGDAVVIVIDEAEDADADTR